MKSYGMYSSEFSFLHSMLCLWNSSMLLYVVVVSSFSLLNTFNCIIIL